MRRGWSLALAVGLLGLAAGVARAETKLEVTHFPGGGTWPILAAQANGYFATADIAIHLDPITSSVAQITGMMEGKYDLGMTAFDNVIAYDAGQGETKLAGEADLVAFLGGEGGSLHLITAPEVKTVEGLKGKTLAVDAKSTGYAFVLYRIAAMHGLAQSDYSILAVGSSQKRLDALIQGQAAGTLLSKPFDAFATAKGFTDLVAMNKLFPHYQSTVGFTRRPWAKDHRDVLIAFIRAYVQGSLWLFDSSHKEGAIDLLLKSTPNLSRDQAEAIYSGTVGADSVTSPMAALDPAGVKTVVALRSEFGEPKKRLDAQQFYDLSFYKAAISR
jgi:ABC-type nitrate/sulfonate/bicarbonate transport system substrate-binding protein